MLETEKLVIHVMQRVNIYYSVNYSSWKAEHVPNNVSRKRWNTKMLVVCVMVAAVQALIGKLT